MASYTTPRTANVGDIWTAAWYNAEVRDDIKWAHDLLISAGSSFPASPVSGQRHLLVVGDTRLLFTYDGTHWLSDEFRVGWHITTSNPQWNSGLADLFATGAFPFSDRPMVDVADAVHTAGGTLQARLTTYVSKVSGTGTATVTLTAATAALGGAFGSFSAVSGSTTPSQSASGYKSGAWADVASGAVDAVSLDLQGDIPSGSATWQLVQAVAHLRFKV